MEDSPSASLRFPTSSHTSRVKRNITSKWISRRSSLSSFGDMELSSTPKQYSNNRDPRSFSPGGRTDAARGFNPWCEYASLISRVRRTHEDCQGLKLLALGAERSKDSQRIQERQQFAALLSAQAAELLLGAGALAFVHKDGVGDRGGAAVVKE